MSYLSTPPNLSAGWPVPILMYHAVEPILRPPRYKHFYVEAREFAWQMRALKAGGYRPITFAQLEMAMAGKLSLPRRPVILTFDDGYFNLIEHVHPLLLELDFVYTVFLVSGKVGKENDWVAADGYETTRLLGWDDIRHLQQSGLVSFEAHTVSHPHLTELSPADAKREMSDCRTTLEQTLQAPVRVLCYPYGDVNDAVAQTAKEAGFTMAVTTKTGRVRASDDRLRLPRLSVYHVPPLSLTYGSGALNFWWRVRVWKDSRPSAVTT